MITVSANADASRSGSLSSAPTGATYDSPGQRPGFRAKMISSPEGAAQTGDRLSEDVAHFQRSISLTNGFPGRCPRAIVFLPVGAGESAVSHRRR